MERNGRKKCGFYLGAGAAVLAALTACSRGHQQEKAPGDDSYERADPRAELDAAPGAKGGSAQGDAVANDMQSEPVQFAENIPETGYGTDNDLQGQTGRMGEPPIQVTGTPEVKVITSEFSTWYGSSGPERRGNIERAAELLNGTVIEPGGIFSCAAGIGPITEDNGYLPAGTFVQGKVEEGIGGGVCQVSTTLYNAALLSGLTIVERSPHSMAVGYVDPARDAAIAGSYKDLKLRNDYAYPVMIEALTEDGMLYFRIHTSEEDIGNTIELESVVLEEIAPGPPIVTIDEILPPDSYMVTQKAHTGYIAELYRVVSRDGIEILREKVNTSSYAATPEYATAGSDFR